MSNRGYRGRRRRRITGRFYAIVTVVFVLFVMAGVLIANRSASTPSPNPNPPTQPVVAQPTDAPSPTEGADGTVLSSDGATGTDEAQTNSGMASIDELIEMDPDLAPATGAETMDTSDLSVTPGLSEDWRNILLLGSDSRNIKKVSRTDTIMIASINTKDGRIKLVSIMRDMIVPMTNKKGVTQDVKINTIVHYGAADAVMKKVNELFGMNITEYVMVNFASFQKVIDILNGVRIDVTKAEMDEINKSLGEQAKALGTMTQEEFLAKKDSLELDSYGGDKLLTGIQALGYARIRHVGSGDYKRTERQRTLLDAVLKKVKQEANPVQLMQIGTQMFSEIETNINLMSAVSIATTVIKNGGKMDNGWRMPGTSTHFVSETRGKTNALWDTDFEANKALLYKYIYES